MSVTPSSPATTMSKSSSFSSLQNLESNESSPKESDANLIINYIPHEMTDNQLKDLFSEHGPIAYYKIVRDKLTKRSLGYGFIRYYNTDHANDAINLKNGYQVGSKKLKVTFARPPSQVDKNCKLYVTNIPPIATNEMIYELFSKYGNIIEHRIVRKTNCKSSNNGVAFIQYSQRSEALEGLKLNGYNFSDQTTITVKFAESDLISNTTKSYYQFDDYQYNYNMNDVQGNVYPGEGYDPMNLVIPTPHSSTTHIGTWSPNSTQSYYFTNPYVSPRSYVVNQPIVINQPIKIVTIK
eukprot:gene17318-22859_t